MRIPFAPECRDHLYDVRNIAGDRIYIGRTAYPATRQRDHARRWPDAAFRILAIGHHQYICELERALISYLKARQAPLQNIAPGGNNPPSQLGKPLSAAARAKLVAALRTPAVRATKSAASKRMWQSDEYRSKVCAALKGKPKPLGHGAKVAAALRGRPKSAAHRLRLSMVARGRPGHPHTTASRRKIAAANSRRVYSPETRAKISAAGIRNREWLSDHFKGRMFSEDVKCKMSESAKRRWSREQEQGIIRCGLFQRTAQEARNP